MVSGTKLKDYRKQRRVSQQELAEQLGRGFARHVSRLEKRELKDVEYAEAIAAIERILARRQSAATPVDVALRTAEGAAS